MPPKKQARSSRGRRPVARRPAQTGTTNGQPDDQTPTAGTTATPAPTRSAAARSRSSRAPAQIVIGDYSYLRHDLRLLGVLAPSLIIIMVVLSFVLH